MVVIYLRLFINVSNSSVYIIPLSDGVQRRECVDNHYIYSYIVFIYSLCSK
jgi:hypothetical protein